MEGILLDTMFDLPRLEGVEEMVISKEVVEGTWAPGPPQMQMGAALHRTMVDEALFKKEQQLREGQQAMAEYQAELRAMREKTARLRARDSANQKTPPTNGRVSRNTAKQS
jgi:hypothetical protein